MATQVRIHARRTAWLRGDTGKEVHRVLAMLLQQRIATCDTKRIDTAILVLTPEAPGPSTEAALWAIKKTNQHFKDHMQQFHATLGDPLWTTIEVES